MACRFPPITVFAPSMVALALLTACPGGGSEGDEDETSGSETGTEAGNNELCEDPGTALFDEARPVGAASKTGNPPYVCASGWGWDAAWNEPAWSIRLPSVDTGQDEPWQPAAFVIAHPEGGVVTYGSGDMRHYDSDGNEVWSESLGGFEVDMYMAVEEAGTLLVARNNYQGQNGVLTRFGVDGSEMETIEITWNTLDFTSIWALETSGPNIVLGAYDEDSNGEYEETLLVLDPEGNELLRRSRTLFGGIALAVDDNGTAIFGNNPAFVVSLADGAVLGQITPSQGFAFGLVGSGDRYYQAGNITNDFSVGAYTATGAEQWLQSYDRAGLSDFARVLDARDGVVVAAGTTSGLNWAKSYWTNSQPMILATDTEGNALWHDRIDAFGDAIDLTIGADGSVYLSGIGETDTPPNTEPEQLRWLRKYDPM